MNLFIRKKKTFILRRFIADRNASNRIKEKKRDEVMMVVYGKFIRVWWVSYPCITDHFAKKADNKFELQKMEKMEIKKWV